MTPQFISFVDKSHPITKGLGDGFDVTDEAYACHWFEDSVQSARAHRLPAGGSDEEPESESEVQQPRGMGEDGREQPGVLHAGRPWRHRLGDARPIGSSSAMPSSGPRRPRRWPGRRQIQSASSIRQISRGTMMRMTLQEHYVWLAVALGDRAWARHRCSPRDSGAAGRSRWPSSPRATTSTATGSSISGIRSARTSPGPICSIRRRSSFSIPRSRTRSTSMRSIDAPGTHGDSPVARRQADVRAAECLGEEEPDPVPAEGQGARVLPSLARRVEPHLARIQRDDRHRRATGAIPSRSRARPIRTRARRAA